MSTPVDVAGLSDIGRRRIAQLISKSLDGPVETFITACNGILPELHADPELTGLDPRVLTGGAMVLAASTLISTGLALIVAHAPDMPFEDVQGLVADTWGKLKELATTPTPQ